MWDEAPSGDWHAGGVIVSFGRFAFLSSTDWIGPRISHDVHPTTGDRQKTQQPTLSVPHTRPDKGVSACADCSPQRPASAWPG
jgi:hypothetical protein